MHCDSEKIDLLIISCECKTYLGKLASVAARALSNHPGVRYAQFQSSMNDKSLNENIRSSDRTIAVDGCEKQCIKKALVESNSVYEFYLLLTDLGFDELTKDEITDDDLQLAIDGIVAESPRVSRTTPRLPGGCCC